MSQALSKRASEFVYQVISSISIQFDPSSDESKDVAVLSTIIDANDRGFECLVAQDACTAASVDLHWHAIDIMRSEGGIFGCVSDVQKIVEVIDLHSLQRSDTAS